MNCILPLSKIISLVILLFYFSKAFSQRLTSPFEILKEKKEIVYGIDNRRTHIHQHHTVIYGLYSGISFGGKLRFKIGINGIPFEVGKFVDDNGVLKKNRLLFASVGEECDFYQYKKIGVTTYLQAGIGNNFYRRINTSGTEINTGKERIIPIEAGLHFNYDLLTYLKLRTGFGWRFVTPNNSRELSGYYVKLGLGFSFKKFNETRAEYKTTTR